MKWEWEDSQWTWWSEDRTYRMFEVVPSSDTAESVTLYYWSDGAPGLRRLATWLYDTTEEALKDIEQAMGD